MRHGTIVYWNGAGDKCFGFIKPDRAEDGSEHNVFFHQTRYLGFGCDGSDSPIETGWQHRPVKGDRVLFRSEWSVKGERATFVALEESYQAALDAIEKRPTYIFRERNGAILKSRLEEKPTYRTL